MFDFNDKTQSYTLSCTWTPITRLDGMYVREKIGETLSVWGPLPKGMTIAQFVDERKRVLEQITYMYMRRK